MAKNSPVWVQYFPRPPTSLSAGLLPAAAREHRASHRASSITSSITSHRIAQIIAPGATRTEPLGHFHAPWGIWAAGGRGDRAGLGLLRAMRKMPWASRGLGALTPLKH